MLKNVLRNLLKNEKVNKLKRKVVAVAVPLSSMLSVGVTSHAGDVGQVTSGLNNLKMLFVGVVAIIGVIVLVKGVVDFSSALSDRDSSGMKQAGLIIAGGFIMAAIGSVLGFLGF